MILKHLLARKTSKGMRVAAVAAAAPVVLAVVVAVVLAPTSTADFH